jgi:hypothetical protein
MCVNLLRHILEDRVIQLIIAGTSNLTEVLYIEQSGILWHIACHISQRFL